MKTFEICKAEDVPENFSMHIYDGYEVDESSAFFKVDDLYYFYNLAWNFPLQWNKNDNSVDLIHLDIEDACEYRYQFHKLIVVRNENTKQVSSENLSKKEMKTFEICEIEDKATEQVLIKVPVEKETLTINKMIEAITFQQWNEFTTSTKDKIISYMLSK